MSYELPFSKPGGWSVQKGILLGLIVLHAVWLVIHMNLVSHQLINPWKLGGYGMYTTVNPAPALSLFDRRIDGFEIPIDDKDRVKLASENNFFIFRCQPLRVASLQTFLKNNPRFTGAPLRFILTEQTFLRDPIRAERLPHSILEIRWTGQDSFDYAGKICGKIFRGKSKLRP
ncbi:MAG: hypothetical protein HKP56_10930 [Anderseniella sp.]|nr:hypothetical protein [Anderseniella sp.]